MSWLYGLLTLSFLRRSCAHHIGYSHLLYLKQREYAVRFCLSVAVSAQAKTVFTSRVPDHLLYPMLASPFLYAWGAVEVLYAWGAVSPDGIIVSDSGAFIRGNEHWSVYMEDVLQALYERTGLRCMLVARGGLAFVNHWKPSCTYEHVLRAIKARCDVPGFVLWVSLGNDLYPPRPDMGSYQPRLLAALDSFLTEAFAYCPHNCFVYGGSSDVWQYYPDRGGPACREYDRLVGIVIEHILQHRRTYPQLDARTGADLLHGVQLADRIGHFSAASMGIIREFFTTVVSWASVERARSRL